jgi:hypothetical protein
LLLQHKIAIPANFVTVTVPSGFDRFAGFPYLQNYWTKHPFVNQHKSQNNQCKSAISLAEVKIN